MISLALTSSLQEIEGVENKINDTRRKQSDKSRRCLTSHQHTGGDGDLRLQYKMKYNSWSLMNSGFK